MVDEAAQVDSDNGKLMEHVLYASHEVFILIIPFKLFFSFLLFRVEI